jgi:predicted  nucleic acid-binding Zn-ribbon protein
MPHQCVRCGIIYADTDNHVLQGCSCGAKLFFYVKKSALERAKQVQKELSDEDKTQIVKDVLGLVAGEGTNVDADSEIEKLDEPIVLDFESINVTEPGKYEIDLVHLFSGKPLVYKMEDGKYIIDLPTSFQMSGNDPNKKKKKR